MASASIASDWREKKSVKKALRNIVTPGVYRVFSVCWRSVVSSLGNFHRVGSTGCIAQDASCLLLLKRKHGREQKTKGEEEESSLRI